MENDESLDVVYLLGEHTCIQARILYPAGAAMLVVDEATSSAQLAFHVFIWAISTECPPTQYCIHCRRERMWYTKER